MNRLIRIMSFVLPFFCLLINVSYAGFDSTIVGKTAYSSANTSDTIAGYTINQIRGFFNSSDISSRDLMLEKLKNAGYYVLWVPYKNDYTSWLTYVFPINSGIDYGAEIEYDGRFIFNVYLSSGDYCYYRSSSTTSTTSPSKFTITTSGYHKPSMSTGSTTAFTAQQFEEKISSDDNFYGSFPYLKKLSYNSGYYWNGSDYLFYRQSSGGDDGETPALPSNAEIAQAVQAFYNSDYYKNNTDFSDFMVLYNYDNQNFSFVGHNFGINLGQVIVPSDYEYEGYSYGQDWWKFFLRNITSQIASNLWNRYYYLYNTADFGSSFTYYGKGSINDLIGLHFSTSSIIVYSTTDYPVVKIETDENGVFSPVEGTILGNQYTYDENLDPTTNEYNPLENFIPINPNQSILGDIDFDEINKVFEDNKNILNIENASWLFSANNQLVNYFIGFLLLLIVFLIISRVLGG